MTTTTQFRRAAARAIADEQLQQALERATGSFGGKRTAALSEVPDVEEMRDHFKAVRSATLKNLAHHLETFEEQAKAKGIHVHWAQTGEDANRIVVEIAQRRGVTLATKSKSMATEEIHLNAALEEAGITPVETDLGEYIIQLADEPPSHIIAPIIHKTRHQVAELLSEQVGSPLDADDVPAMTAEARRLLREQFLDSGMGISGGNILVAETGSLVLVMNEGNGRLVTSAPPVHVALVGIEKLAPTWNDAAVWLSLLARSATGQALTIYTNVINGPAHEGDADGPEEVHIILLDNGRSALVGTKYEEVLQCIRCGACLNACPVYKQVGGHSYGSPYSGPIGAVITPLLFGLENHEALPQASSLCGACKDVCPARIDLPRMLLELRADEVEQRLMPAPERLAEEAAAFALGEQKRMRRIFGLARFGQKPFVRDGSLKLPLINPTEGRRLPTLADKSFHELWEEGIDA